MDAGAAGQQHAAAAGDIGVDLRLQRVVDLDDIRQDDEAIGREIAFEIDDVEGEAAFEQPARTPP